MAKRTGGFIGQDGLNAPDPATGVSASGGDTQATVSFTAPSDVGGSAITGYRVQDSTGAFGIVESGVSGSTTVSLIGIEGAFNTANNLRREGQNGFITNLASVPSTITDIYTNKPHWTSTLDGGTF